jgi:outer membrane protein assembly factor BamE (lipoprotein component of BamABCDE complex)
VSGILYWFNAGHGASLSRLNQIRPGMSQKAVVQELGKPTTINKHDDSQSWFYTRGTFCLVAVHFDRNGAVVRAEHDH